MSFVNTVDLIGDEALTNSIIDKSITEISDNYVTTITTMAFFDCRNLVSAIFQSATNIGTSAFSACSKLSAVKFPLVKNIGNSAFESNAELSVVDFPVATSIAMSAFNFCTSLATLILRSETVCALSNTASFHKSPIASGTGYIYVPRDLVDTYKSATNWSTYAAQFRALENYTVDGTTTGALDETKI